VTTGFQKLQEKMTALFSQLYVEEQKILVFGDGPTNARIAMIGEAPGAEETLQGRPFVGKAGKQLDEFLEMTGLERKAIYITNVVKFRPTKRSESGRLSNRPPTGEEVKLFLPWLVQELELVKPKIIVTLGNVPLKALMGKQWTIGQAHGQWLTWEKKPLYPLYHPASLIYNRSLKDVYEGDVRRLAQSIGEKIYG